MSGWLIDRSALARLGDSVAADQWSKRVERGQVRISTLTKLEVGLWARSPQEARHALTIAPIAVLPVEHLTPAAEQRAIEVQLLLTGAGDTRQRRPVPVPALLIAAMAELADLTVLHLSDDFDLIAQVTVQPVQRLQMPDAQSDVSTTHASASPVISRIRSTR